MESQMDILKKIHETERQAEQMTREAEAQAKSLREQKTGKKGTVPFFSRVLGLGRPHHVEH